MHNLWPSFKIKVNVKRRNFCHCTAVGGEVKRILLLFVFSVLGTGHCTNKCYLQRQRVMIVLLGKHHHHLLLESFRKTALTENWLKKCSTTDTKIWHSGDSCFPAFSSSSSLSTQECRQRTSTTPQKCCFQRRCLNDSGFAKKVPTHMVIILLDPLKPMGSLRRECM